MCTTYQTIPQTIHTDIPQVRGEKALDYPSYTGVHVSECLAHLQHTSIWSTSWATWYVRTVSQYHMYNTHMFIHCLLCIVYSIIIHHVYIEQVYTLYRDMYIHRGIGKLSACDAILHSNTMQLIIPCLQLHVNWAGSTTSTELLRWCSIKQHIFITTLINTTPNMLLNKERGKEGGCEEDRN